MNEQSERYQMLSEAIRELVELGATRETLDVICLECGFQTNHLEQIIEEADQEVLDYFKNLVFLGEGRN